MNRDVLLDTGPLVAFLNRRDRYHRWACDALATVAPPLHTCEAVVSEACFLLRGLPRGQDSVLDLLDRGLLRIDLTLTAEVPAIRQLVEKYRDVPISLAEACLVRLSELRAGSTLLTLDRHFRIYRRHGRRVIPTLMPPA